MPQDPFIREKFTREHTAARKLAEEYFERYPKDRYQTEVESWRSAVVQHRIYTETPTRADRSEIAANRWQLGVECPQLENLETKPWVGKLEKLWTSLRG